MAMSREQYEERAQGFGRVVARAWSDEAFKQRLLADPKATLEAEGLPFPEGAEVRAMENTDRLVYFRIPPKPAGLSIQQLSGMAGGVTVGTYDTGGTLNTPNSWGPG